MKSYCDQKTHYQLYNVIYISWAVTINMVNSAFNFPFTASVVAVHEYPPETIHSLCNFKRPGFQGVVTSYT